MTTVGYGDMTYVPFWDSGPTNHAMEQVQRSRDQKRVKTCLVFASENVLPHINNFYYYILTTSYASNALYSGPPERILGPKIFLSDPFKVENISKGSLDLIPSPSVKIQFMGEKVCLECKGKTLLGVVKKFLIVKSLLTMPSYVLPLLRKQTLLPII